MVKILLLRSDTYYAFLKLRLQIVSVLRTFFMLCQSVFLFDGALILIIILVCFCISVHILNILLPKNLPLHLFQTYM